MYIKARVSAGMKKESFVQKSPDTVHISVKERAERNMANSRVTELVAAHFNVSKGKVRIISGHQGPSKILSVGIE